MKPLIGLNLDCQTAKPGTPLWYCLHSGYTEAIERAGGIPILVPPLRDEADIHLVLNALNGFVLTGGPDLDPRNDGWELHKSNVLMDRAREKFDRELVKQLSERDMPTFGIGCGMQLINVAMGGTLMLNIPDDRPGAIPHLDATDPNHSHSLEVENDTILARVYGGLFTPVRVNSRHHMAVEDVARGFRATAKCPDGIIEAIESTTDWPCFGTQFHPERGGGTLVDSILFEEFVRTVTSKSMNRRKVA